MSSPSPSQAALVFGGTNLLIGLKSAARLNGKRVIVISDEATDGRWTVELDDLVNPEPLKVKPENLVACCSRVGCTVTFATMLSPLTPCQGCRVSAYCTDRCRFEDVTMHEIVCNALKVPMLEHKEQVLADERARAGSGSSSGSGSGRGRPNNSQNANEAETMKLFQACYTGKPAEVASILSQPSHGGADINKKQGGVFQGATPVIATICGPKPIEFAIKILTMLADAGADLHAVGNINAAAVNAAAESGKDELLKVLLARGCNPNHLTIPCSVSPLFMACQNRFPRCVKLLIAAGADVNHRVTAGYTPLIKAAEKGELDIVKQLVKVGAKVNLASTIYVHGETLSNRTAIMHAAQCGHSDVVEFLVKSGGSLTRSPSEVSKGSPSPIGVAVMSGNVDTVRTMLRLQPQSINNDQITLACMKISISDRAGQGVAVSQQLEALKVILEHCKTVKDTTGRIILDEMCALSMPSPKGNARYGSSSRGVGEAFDGEFFSTPLIMCATTNGISSNDCCKRIAEMLVKTGGATPDLIVKSTSALHAAAHSGTESFVSLLLKLGSSTDLVLDDPVHGNITPLVFAVKAGRVGIARILLSSGANSRFLTHIDLSGDTSVRTRPRDRPSVSLLRLAVHLGNLELVRLLVQSLPDEGQVTEARDAAPASSKDIIKLLDATLKLLDKKKSATVIEKCSSSTCTSGEYASLICSRCRSKRYCCDACQRYDWKNGHKQCCMPPVPID